MSGECRRRAGGLGHGFWGAVLSCVLLWGCGTIKPRGFTQLSRAERLAITAATGHLYGLAPTRWTLPGGRHVRVDVQRALVTSLWGVHQADLAFDVSWERGSSRRIRCQTGTSGVVPATRFGCWSRGDDGASHRFWMAQGPGCDAGNEIRIETLTTPQCWVGELTASAGRYVVEYGRLEAADAAIGLISWVDARGTPVLAADMISELRIDLFSRSPDAGSIREALILQTVALHFWSHASRVRSPG